MTISYPSGHFMKRTQSEPAALNRLAPTGNDNNLYAFSPYPVDTAKCGSILLPGIRACTFGPAIASRRRGDNRMECIGDVANGSNKPG